ncbi:MAG: DHH family phosphoesterase [Candidatus Margulisbacteria bacterium]|nr:DHH family phosphoesterase [Candidatus Margulisiibacteriota bacterium]
MEIVRKILKKLLKAKKILLICHVDPDGDTTWSALALKKLLMQKRVQVKIVCADALPENVTVFKETKDISRKLPSNWKWDLVVAMEAGDKKRLGFSINVDINIDHHFDNTRYANLNWIDAQASALGSMIYCICKLGKFKITKEIASLLYAAICSDTGGFRFGNTKQQTFADVYELVKKGAKPDQIYHLIYENVSEIALKKLGQALCDLKVIEQGKIVYSVANKVDNETGHGIIDVIRTVRGSEIAILFKELDEKNIKVSLRSKNNFNVQEIAKIFGGGGHKKAAGCELPLSLNEAVEKVLTEIRKKLSVKK